MINYTVVHEFIKVTAGRFYTPSQIVRIASLVLGGNLIWQKKEKEEWLGILTMPELLECDDPNECGNMKLLLSLAGEDERKQRCFEEKKDFLQRTGFYHKWKEKEDWVRYIRTNDEDFSHVFEKAYFSYSLGKVDDAILLFKTLADNFHILSVKALCAIYHDKKDYTKELWYLTLLEKIYKELLMEDCPALLTKRIEQLLAKGLEEVRNNALSLKIDYFDEEKIGRTIGFRV